MPTASMKAVSSSSRMGRTRVGIGADNSRGEGTSNRCPQDEDGRRDDAEPEVYRSPVNQQGREAPPIHPASGSPTADRVHGQLAVHPDPDRDRHHLAVGNSDLSKPFDPYPFILLNLAFSTQAAYAAPLILLAGNRSALRDRLTLEHAAAEADIEDAQNIELLDGNLKILEHIDTLEHRILDLEKSILDAVKGIQPPG